MRVSVEESLNKSSGLKASGHSKNAYIISKQNLIRHLQISVLITVKPDSRELILLLSQDRIAGMETKQ